MIKQVFIFIAIFIWGINAFGQFSYLQNYIKFIQPKTTLFYSLEDRGDQIGSFNNESSFLYSKTNGEKIYYSIVIKRGEEFLVFDPFENIPNAKPSINRAFQFDGKGKDELIIHWKQSVGEIDMGNGTLEENKGVTLIDLEQGKILFSFKNYSKKEKVWTNYGKDASGNIDYDNVLEFGEKVECERYDVQVDEGSIKVRYSLDQVCNATPDPSISDFDVCYKLAEEGLIRTSENTGSWNTNVFWGH